MKKSVHSAAYRTFLGLLREIRTEAGVSQEALAARLGESQSFISKCERGERRLDILEARAICKALGEDFSRFVARLERHLKRESPKSGPQVRAPGGR